MGWRAALLEGTIYTCAAGDARASDSTASDGMGDLTLPILCGTARFATINNSPILLQCRRRAGLARLVDEQHPTGAGFWTTGTIDWHMKVTLRAL